MCPRTEEKNRELTSIKRRLGGVECETACIMKLQLNFMQDTEGGTLTTPTSQVGQLAAALHLEFQLVILLIYI